MPEGFINTSSDSLLASVGQAPATPRTAEEQAAAEAQDAANRETNLVVNPFYKEPVSRKLPVTPTKINVETGAGVPGGFDASSIKSPTAEVEKIGGTLSSIAAMAGTISAAAAAVAQGLIPPIPGLSDASKKLDGLKSKYMNKLKISAKVPDFSKSFKLPDPPRLPTVPNFKSLGIPDIPALPTVPSVAIPSVAIPSVAIPSVLSIAAAKATKREAATAAAKAAAVKKNPPTLPKL